MGLPTVNSRRQCLYLLLAVLACLRSVLTIVTAVLTWLTIWHFSATPFPLFYGWTFALVFLTIGSAKAVACSSPTTRLILRLWHWGRWSTLDIPGSIDSPVLSISSPPSKYPIKADRLPHYGQPVGTISTQQHSPSSSCCQFAARLLRLIAAISALLALFTACMVVHGGAVLADWHLAMCYLARRSAISTQEQRQTQQLLRDAQQSATECTVTLALCFVAPSVAIKWGLVMFLGDMSVIPVLSTVLSSISYAAILSNFLATTYISGTGWSMKQRALGIAAVATTVLTQFLWRLAARSFLVLKFGGEVFFFYIIVHHAQIALGVLIRSKDSRTAYKEAFASNRVQVFLLTLHGSAMAYDFPTFLQGLKSRQVASRAEWLKRLLFGYGTLGMLAWRIFEGIAVFIVILAIHPLQPCDSHTSPDNSWYQVCAAEVSRKLYVWRPKCWGCSMFDMYASQQMYGVPVIVLCMLLVAGLILLWLLGGLLVLQRLLSCYTLSKQLATDANSSGAARSHGKHSAVHRFPAERIIRQHPLDESEYAYAMHGAGLIDSVCSSTSTTAPSRTYMLPSVGLFGQPGCLLDVKQPAVGSVSCQEADNAQAVATPDVCQHPPRESAGDSTAFKASGLIDTHGVPDVTSKCETLRTAAYGSLVGLSSNPSVDTSSKSVISCSSQSPMLSVAQAQARSSYMNQSGSVVINTAMSSIQGSSQTASSNMAGGKATSVSGTRLLLRALAMLWLVVVCDVVVFNCHWLLQMSMLVVGVLYCLWVHVEFLFRSNSSVAV